MNTFVHIDGKRIVNLDHVALVTFFPEHKAIRQVYSDMDGREHPLGYIEHDSVELVLVAPSDRGCSSSTGLEVRVTHENARDLWEYFETRADIPNLEREENQNV
jgi:hypothetical protein